MLLSTNTYKPNFILHSMKDSILSIADAGFDAYDMSYCDLNTDDFAYYLGANYASIAREIRKVADDRGIVCNQAHAPFPSSRGNENDEAIFESIRRSIEASAILGAKAIVVHPKQHLNYAENRNELRKLNIDFYSRLIPFCKDYGINVAVENMWQGSRFSGSRIVDSTCSSPEEFCDYIDSIGSEYIVGCLDIGHAALVDRKPEDLIHALGSKRLKALHVHDVDGLRDLHTLPYHSTLDFNSIAKALADIGYTGDFTFEAGNFIPNHLPAEIVTDALKYMCAVGRHIISLIEKYQKQ